MQKSVMRTMKMTRKMAAAMRVLTMKTAKIVLLLLLERRLPVIRV